MPLENFPVDAWETIGSGGQTLSVGSIERAKLPNESIDDVFGSTQYRSVDHHHVVSIGSCGEQGAMMAS